MGSTTTVTAPRTTATQARVCRAPQGGDIFLTKHDAMGNVAWVKVIGDIDSQSCAGLAVTPTGGVVMTGTVTGIVNFGGGPVNGASSDAYIAAYDAAGAHLFSKRFGDATFQYGRGVAVNQAGEIALVVSLQGSANFGGGVLTSAGSSDVVVAKFTSTGAHLWSKRFGAASQQEARDVAYDPSGNIVLSGTTSGPIDFGGGPVSPPSTAGFFAAKLDPAGGSIWTRVYGTVGNFNLPAPSVAVDGGGNVLVAGSFVDSMDLGGGLMTAFGQTYDVFALKLSSAGTHLWSKQFGDPAVQEYDECHGLATDPTGNVLLTGLFGNTIDFGLGPISSGDTNTYDVFIAKLSP